MVGKEIPDIIVGRLPIYLRALRHMREDGQQTTSSQELGKQVGISAAQIRKDLSQFGEFGKQGTGYLISYLIDKLCEILKVDRVWDVAVVGAGDMGHALTRYQGFFNRGFRITMIFDNNPDLLGKKIGDLTIQSTDALVSALKAGKVSLAMLTVPATAAQKITDLLVEAGVKAILNYAPISLNVPEGVIVQYIDPSTHLQRMTYYL
ncbi:MAG: redox-sensing transcriptional repressor Rex [Chloroflexi bacterium GWB2_49_20]|nr:MAG: redox-sensing transcriptional repressor Rex [Chloroflexi bacterium GWB2_49_20]OGN79657.1 MAG: redox-sensing transcriptional repressor Rex [Chloroflexi bacterium GWC2_49_37]OGN84621.1 MAG: redox-sensing transcriptional repressor Rex [Chloroflexi bacterium GWD2_49_16]HBG74071.1 redox-sensing transcriptional repressor Rex [Anaerolineae bacterium]HCC78873.1 redox-sensing transcriptional repressor Rex [Anaerolineae bacterium]